MRCDRVDCFVPFVNLNQFFRTPHFVLTPILLSISQDCNEFQSVLPQPMTPHSFTKLGRCLSRFMLQTARSSTLSSNMQFCWEPLLLSRSTFRVNSSACFQLCMFRGGCSDSSTCTDTLSLGTGECLDSLALRCPRLRRCATWSTSASLSMAVGFTEASRKNEDD